MAIETIVAAVGRGENEAERAGAVADTIADLATPTGADVILLHAFGEQEFENLAEQLDFDRPSDATPDAAARRHSATRMLVDRLEDHGVGYTVRGEVGDDAGSAVVAAATDLGADMVLVGGRKRTPAGKAVFGSTAQQVMLNAPCPVTYVRTE